MWDSLSRKMSYLLLLAAYACMVPIAVVYSYLYKKNKKKKVAIKRIAAVWYSPPDLAGSNIRMGNWAPFFEKEGIHWDNFYVNDMVIIKRLYDTGTWAQKYAYYRITLTRRWIQFFQLKNYDVVWMHRGLVPAFPFTQSIFEECVARMVPRLVVDSTDGGDYLHGPKLTTGIMQAADRITVGFKSLYEFYSASYKDVHWINWTIPTSSYMVKTSYACGEKPVLGWMGSPSNYEFLLALSPVLEEVAKHMPFRLTYICRLNMELNIPGVEIDYRNFGDDYYELISQFDIGLSPYFDDSIRAKGKIAMKSQEFMICALPMVCSPVAISEHLKDGENAMLAANSTEWVEKLLCLMKDEKLREKLGVASRQVFLQHYTYESQWPALRKALLDWDEEAVN